MMKYLSLTLLLALSFTPSSAVAEDNTWHDPDNIQNPTPLARKRGGAYIAMGAAVREDDTLFMLALGYQFESEKMYYAIEFDFVGKSDDSCDTIIYGYYSHYHTNSCSNFGISGRVGVNLGAVDAFGILGYSTSSDDALNDLKGFRYGAGLRSNFSQTGFFVGAEYIYQDYEAKTVLQDSNHNRYNLYVGYKF